MGFDSLDLFCLVWQAICGPLCVFSLARLEPACRLAWRQGDVVSLVSSGTTDASSLPARGVRAS